MHKEEWGYNIQWPNLHENGLEEGDLVNLEYCNGIVFSKGGYPITLLPPPRRLVPSLGLGTTWVRQPRSGSCHYPTSATKCNEQPSQATANPVTALYTQHLLDSQSFEFEIDITRAQYAANTLHQHIFPREAIPSHYIYCKFLISMLLLAISV